MHENCFKTMKKFFCLKILLKKKKITMLKKYKKIPIPDPFHLNKNDRSHLINHNILIDCNSDINAFKQSWYLIY